MTQDWKDMLASLAGETTPDENSQDAPEASAEDSIISPSSHPVLHIVLDKKGRKGKVATIIEGFVIPDEEVDSIASDLKRKIGTGGSSRGGEILLQGDWRERVAALLKERGFRVK